MAVKEGLWHSLTGEEVLAGLQSRSEGLTSDEAARRLLRYGPNVFREEKRVTPFQLFIAQFKNFLILLLIAATLLSAALGEFLDALVIFALVLATALLGFLQDYRSEKALEALKRMTSPTATVLRDGEEREIPAAEVVPGDILLLASGDKVPADGRLLQAFHLSTDEASLTGESTPVVKDAGMVLPFDTLLGDRRNMVFAGSIVASGRGRAVVTSTGMETEFGRIARMLQVVEEAPSPLAVKMDYIGRRLGAACLIIAAAVILLGILRGHPPLPMVIWGVSLAIAAVPEALAAVVTGALAIGVERMARRQALVRRLPAVETLGCTTVICSDKTGTLTKNEMTVRRLSVGNRFVEVTGVGFEPVGSFLWDGKPRDPLSDPTLARLLQAAALCGDAHLRWGDEGWQIKGDPTEGALVVAAAKAKLNLEELKYLFPRIGEIPFEPERKRMTTIHRDPDGRLIAYVKGAPEQILVLSTHWEREGEREVVSAPVHQALLEMSDQMAQGALRVLGVAYRELPEAGWKEVPESVEADLTFLGLVGMMDPPREEVKAAIRTCQEAGIRPVMVTGDHKLTAAAIAQELGLLKEGQQLLEGRDLDRMTEEELAARAEGVSVYARVSPEHKLKIVGALKRLGHVVAMTGDGVNDAPALKRADIGIAMGITGTDVAKEASDMVLLDDNFATIAAAVEEGRAIYENIRKYLVFLLSANVGEILVLGSAGLIGLPLPLLALQILWVNLITDGPPALALGVEPAEPDLMRRSPRNPREPVFTKGIQLSILGMATLMFFGLMPLFYGYWRMEGLTKARTMTLVGLILFELFFAFSCRSFNFTILGLGPWTNRWLVLAVGGSLILLLAVLYVPLLASAFHTVPIQAADWAVALTVSGIGFLLVEVGKGAAKRKISVRGHKEERDAYP